MEHGVCFMKGSTCVFPPVLSCTALLERAVLAANDLNAPPKMLLAPKAMSSCRYIQVLHDNKITWRFTISAALFVVPFFKNVT